MPKKLTGINITHISLVKSGANKKSIIYKSSDSTPDFTKQIAIKKSDDEEGVVYGIVYSPLQKDTDDEYATADEIKKAAYGFMKNKNTANVDKDHSFDIEKAYVAQSWITKENDAIFPDEPVGSWAVAIQLEDEELIKSVKDGDIAGISMAGTATKEEDENPSIEKADEKSYSLNDMITTFKSMFSSTSFRLDGHVYNDKVNKSKEDEMNKDEFKKALGEVVEPMQKSIDDLNKKIETLEKSDVETKAVLKKSKQNDDPQKVEIEKENQEKGIL